MFEPREANSGCFSPSSPRPPLTPNACGPDCPQMGTGRSLEGHWSADGREGPQHAWHTLSCSPSLSFLRGVGGGLPVKPSRESWTQTLRRPCADPGAYARALSDIAPGSCGPLDAPSAFFLPVPGCSPGICHCCCLPHSLLLVSLPPGRKYFMIHTPKAFFGLFFCWVVTFVSNSFFWVFKISRLRFPAPIESSSRWSSEILSCL